MKAAWPGAKWVHPPSGAREHCHRRAVGYGSHASPVPSVIALPKNLPDAYVAEQCSQRVRPERKGEGRRSSRRLETTSDGEQQRRRQGA